MKFNELGLIAPILKALTAQGYAEPTPIQRQAIPPALKGRDVLGCAQTGTGKTCAFAAPILQRLHADVVVGPRYIRALILTPTRELALQIQECFEAYGKNLPLRSAVIFGGVGQQPQVDQLNRGVDILVATPGRLNDLIAQGHIRVERLDIFVLDEADRMLDMGFIHDVRKVISHLPSQRQTLFFSATMPAEVEKLATSLLSRPVTVKVDPVSSTVDAIDQSLYLVDKANKKLLLAKLLRQPNVESALVFTRTKHGADRVVKELSRAGIEARSIHGNKSQSARQQALADFKGGRVRVLVATDIAARGIDIAGLSHVFNYDLPNEPEAYVHRIGRTGRAGRDGIAISFCCIDEMKELKQIEKLIGKTLRREQSEWPMQVFEETVKEPRPPRPSREAQPARRTAPVAKPAPPANPAPKAAAQAGRPAQRVAAKPARPAEKPAAKQPAARIARPTEKAPKPARSAQAAPAAQPTPIRQERASQPSYAEMLRRRREGVRRPLSTGNDRY